jgi:4-diphosphocytidyl-2-C-methyl-D-erythritol kinase
VSRTARVSAPAKVNLRLRVLGKRPDGYHEIDTLFQAIDLADDVLVRLGGVGIRLSVAGADVGPAEQNLAHRAAARFAAEFGLREGVEIELTKRIPAGAGLGGGSSDAAATLRALSALVGVASDDGRLASAATSIGSDVPFFLGKSALARGRGRGERLEPLAPLPIADLVLVSPPVHVSTAAAYGALAASRSGAPVATEPAANPASWDEVTSQAFNDFQLLVASAHPEVSRAVDALESSGASFALMSGSGSSAFGLFGGRDRALGAAGELAQRLGWPCRAVRTLRELPPPTLG